MPAISMVASCSDTSFARLEPAKPTTIEINARKNPATAKLGTLSGRTKAIFYLRETPHALIVLQTRRSRCSEQTEIGFTPT